MTIIIEYAKTKFNLLFLNRGNASYRIWEFHNSWGWNTLTMKISQNESKTNAIIKKLRNKGWTKNGPTFFELKTGDRYIIPIDLFDGDWEIPENANQLKMKAVFVKIILEIPGSPEANEFDVFTGKLESNEIILNPPHTWLLRE